MILDKLTKSSFFIENKALFGSYPDKQMIQELINIGMTYIVNLTEETEEGINKYTDYLENAQYISYPIKDKKIPYDWMSFSKFIITVSNIINNLSTGQYIYIHCRGGHGRSCLVVSCLLCYISNISSDEALLLASKYHCNRVDLKEKWKTLESPQSKYQQNFVRKFFEPLKFYKAIKIGFTAGFSNFSYHTVKTELGTFMFSEAAFYAHKNPQNKDYVKSLLNCISPMYARRIGKNAYPENDEKDIDIMYKILVLKFNQNPFVKHNLMSTGLRPIYEHSHYDLFWGDGGEYGGGKNNLGILLVKIRNEFYLNL